MAEPAPEEVKDQAVAESLTQPTQPLPRAGEESIGASEESLAAGLDWPNFGSRRQSGSSTSLPASQSWKQDRPNSGSSRDVSPPPFRSSSRSSIRSLSPNAGYLPPHPLPSLLPGASIPPSPPPPSSHQTSSKSSSPASLTALPSPATNPPPPQSTGWVPPGMLVDPAGEEPESKPAPEEILEARRRMIDDTTARIMLFLLENNRANHSSDYSYSLSLFPLFQGMEPGPEYSYPDNLPKCPIFVDRIGWFPSDEVARYLMMGYRVWDDNGRRLHFAGLPFAFDGLKAPIRYDAKTICTQDPRQVPDLHWQLRKGDLCRPRDSEGFENPMPWDIRLGVPEFLQEGTNLQLVQRAWIQNRFENATPCYFQGDLFRYDHVGGWKVDVSPLNEIPYDERPEWTIGPYSRIGADFQCLTTMYPPTNVTLKGNDALSKLCDLCSALDFKDLFEWGLADVEIDFGTTEQLLERKDCDFCRVLGTLCEDGLDHLRRGNDTSEGRVNQHSFDLSQPIQALFVRDPGHCLTTKPCLVLKQSYHREYLGPIVSLRTVRGEIRGNMSLEDRRFVDFDLLKKMINKCARTHEACKREPGDDDEMILIDVRQMCLVQVKNVQYITLSYVWGQKPIFKTTKSNFESLQMPGALEAVSALTHDVATVVKGLGIQYLWVDALCIIQDNETHKRMQIARMADIYGQSCLTIVALTGTSSASNLPGVSIPRPQTRTVVHGMPFTFHLSGLTQTAHDQIYETRGWTFQERLISRRCLYFTDRQIHLECRHSSMSDHEQIFPENDRGRYATPLNPLQPLHSHNKLEPFSLTALETFTSVVSQYTSRNLTYPSDIENAFLGIQAFMSRKLGWTFIAALPTGVFHWALLWLPRGQLNRRVWISSDGREASPPSWSWLGWEGQVSYGFYDYLHKPLFLRILPRVEDFSLQIGRHSETRIRILCRPSDLWSEEMSRYLRFAPNPAAGPETFSQQEGKDITFTQATTFPLYLHFTAECVSAYQPISMPPSLRSHHPDTTDISPDFRRPCHSTSTPSPSLLPSILSTIEFLTTGPPNGMLRPGLRFDYNLTIENLAKTYQPEDIAIMALVDADVQMTVRGGQFFEDKLFEEKESVVVLLVGRRRIGRKGEDNREEEGSGKEDEKEDDVWERLAVGYLSPETWESMEPKRRTFRLG